MINGLGIILVSVSLCYSVFLNFMFFSKKHIKSSENKVFGYLVAINLFGLINEFACIFTIYFLGKDNFFTIFVNRIFLLYLMFFAFLFSIFILVSCFEKKNYAELSKFQNNFKRFLYVLYGISALILLCLPFEIHNENGEVYSYGAAANMVYVMTGFCAVFCFFSIIVNIKHIKQKKNLPIIAFLVGSLVLTIIQKMNPALTLSTTMETFLIFLMYNTIENPDVKMIQQLEIAKDAADKANSAKTDFLSNMSHEIRTPLNAIVGFSDEIEQSTTLEDAKENAKDIISASNTLLEIVNSILDISKIEAGKLEIINSDYNPKEVFTDLGKLITPKMSEKALDFQVSIADDLPNTLYGDKANIKKVVTNLLSNAYKYTDKGFVKYTVSCVKKDDNCRLIISVEDSGRGMKAENVDKLFTKFQRIDEDRNTTIEGTGLGLALTKQLLELMGGNIIVHTVYGEGSKFTVTLDQRIDNVDLKEENVVSDTIDLSNKRILVVDDNPLNLKVATKLLQRYNADVECCESGFACIDKVQAGEKFDLILMDDMMPKMSGTETFKKLKEITSFDIPVIVLTANAITGMREKYLGDGFVDYLSKPIEKEAMIKSFNLVFKNSTSVVEKKDKKTSNKAKTKTNEGINVEKEKKAKLKPTSVSNIDNCHTKEFLEENGIDVNHGLELLGDMELYDETMRDFVTEMEKRLLDLEKYKSKKDMANYAILVHSIKSDCKYLGIMKLADLAYEHELKSKANDVDYVNNNYEKLIDDINNYVAICKQYLGKD